MWQRAQSALNVFLAEANSSAVGCGAGLEAFVFCEVVFTGAGLFPAQPKMNRPIPPRSMLSLKMRIMRVLKAGTDQPGFLSNFIYFVDEV
jgi:hypothetical protein